MTTLTSTLASRIRENNYRRKSAPGEEMGPGLRDAISNTQVRIDSAFARTTKMAAKLRSSVSTN